MEWRPVLRPADTSYEDRALAERLVPAAARRRLGIFGRAVLEEIGVLDGVQHLVHPRQRIARVAAVDRLQAELLEAAVGNVADVAFDVGRRHALDAAELEGEVDEG